MATTGMEMRNHSHFFSSPIFSRMTSTIQMVTSMKARVNITLFQRQFMSSFVVKRSNGTSEMTPNSRRFPR